MAEAIVSITQLVLSIPRMGLAVPPQTEIARMPNEMTEELKVLALIACKYLS
jgi:hypothetical protein